MTAFDIELRSHASSSSSSTGCGDTLFASLCTRDEALPSSSSSAGNDEGYVCLDSGGSYDVQVPEDTPAGMYSLKVMLAGDNTVFGCTDAFEVTLPVDEAGIVVVAGEPSVSDVVVDPGATTASAAASLAPGSAFTARWVYDDGTIAGGAGSEGTFEINLHVCGDDGDCDDTG